MAKKGGLGKGMEALLGTAPKEETKKVVDNDKSEKDTKKAEVKAAKSTEKKPAAKTTTKSTSKKDDDKKTAEKKTTETKTTVKSGAKKTSAKSSSSKSKTASKAAAPAAEPQEKAEMYLPINKVEPNRDQPRKVFQEDALNELAESIKNFGILQPLLVQKKGDYYQIIAGERRWRAAKIAGLKEVPVVIKDLSEKEILEISLIENLQREDLNPIEEAKGYQQLLQEFGMTQEELAKRVSKSRSAITNTLRLMNLSEKVQEMLSDGRLSAGHARALLPLEDKIIQEEAAERIVRDGLSVRATERLVKVLLGGKKTKKQVEIPKDDYIYRDIEEKMRQILGTKVQIKNRKKSGKIEIEYYSPDELNRILEMLQTIE